MYKMTRHWRAYAWIACLALLFNAFIPLVAAARGSGAMASSAPMDMEVCTAMGMEMLPMPVKPDPAHGGQPAKMMGHCDCCMGHAAAHGLPPPATIAFTLPAGRAVYPPLYYHAPHLLFSWALAQPRAPPVLA
jgi:hypothetical protein